MKKNRFTHRSIDYHDSTYRVIGWREWVSLPNLKIETIKAKIDTGARTSALHAFGIERYQMNGKNMVRFDVHPIQGNDAKIIQCCAELADFRSVRASNGQSERRCFIETTLVMAGIKHTIELSLTNRDKMFFRMLLGRTALERYLIDPCRSFST